MTDTTPPETTISSGPSGTVSSTTASIEFSSSESGSTFECRLDASTWAACSSPKSYSGLTDGSHTFEVRAKDAAGNVDASPASRTFTVAAASTPPPPPPPSSSSPPPAGGYFATVPPGQFDYTITDAQAAAKVHRSSWEPRPQNQTANNTVPPVDFAKPNDGWGTNWDKTYGRVTGNFTGTTDEIIQWGAAKWGIADEILRAILMNESNWYQNLKNTDGTPIHGKGYGDYGHCPSSQAGSPYGDAGPASFGITQVKWCSFNRTDAGNPPNSGGYPWTERSTAYAIDIWGATVRRCFEGWNWMGDQPRGDIWGCIGRWYSGDYNPNQQYVTQAKEHYANKPWRQTGF